MSNQLSQSQSQTVVNNSSSSKSSIFNTSKPNMPASVNDSDSDVDLNDPEEANEESSGISSLAKHHVGTLVEEKRIAETQNLLAEYRKRSQSRQSSRTRKPSIYDKSAFVRMSFDERQKTWEARKKANDEANALIMLTEEQAECTFTPIKARNNSVDLYNSKRGLTKFLEDQENYERDRQLKLENAYKEKLLKEQKEMQARPKIYATSHLIAQKLIPSHVRILSLGKENTKLSAKKSARTELIQSISENEPKFNKSKTFQAKHDDLIRNKLNRNLSKVWLETIGNMSDKLTYGSIEIILKKFGMIKEKEDKANTQRKLIVKLWEILEGAKRGGINFENFKTVLSAIMKIPIKAPNLLESRLLNIADASLLGSTNKSLFGKFSKEKNENFEINEIEMQNLHNTFKVFYYNKISQEKSKGKEEKFSYHPQLSETTRKITSNLKQKRKDLLIQEKKHMQTSFSKKVQNCTIADLLLAQQNQKEKQFAETKKKLEAEKLKECTFRPKLSENTRNINKSLCRSQSKNQNYYRLAKTQRKKTDKTTQEIEFEKSKNELTFTPNIQHKRLKSADICSSKILSNSIMKSYQDSVNRLALARKAFFIYKIIS